MQFIFKLKNTSSYIFFNVLDYFHMIHCFIDDFS